MNVRLVNCFVAVIGLLGACVKGDVTALPSDPPIAPAAQSALNMAPFTGELAKVGPEIDKLMQNASDPATVSMVRNWLIEQDPPTATNPYQEAYAAALNDAFVKALADPKAPITAKINMGIVIKSLEGPKANLAPTVVKLLGDPNAVVAQWGLKAAGAMLPGALQDPNFNNNGQRAAVLAAVTAAVVAHPDGPLAGAIADEAYRAINPKLWSVGPVPTDAALAALIDDNLELQKERLAIYLNKGVPAFPKGDTYPSWLLLANPAWSTMNPAQQLQAVQQAADFVSLAGQRLAPAGATMNMNQDIIDGLVEEGKWINALGQILNDQSIQQVGTDVFHITQGTPVVTIQTACNAVFGALQGNPALTALTPPPTLGGSPGTTPTAPPGAAAPKSASDNSAGSSPTSEARR
jgi:hypothetical protein